MRLDNRLVEALEGIADGLPLPGGLKSTNFIVGQFIFKFFLRLPWIKIECVESVTLRLLLLLEVLHNILRILGDLARNRTSELQRAQGSI